MIFVAILSLAFALPGAFTAQKSDCKKVSYKKLDLIFLLDGSGSVGHKNFVKTLDFVKNVVGQLPIGASETAVGILQYTQVVEDKDKNRKKITRTEITLNAIQNRDQLIDNIGRIKYVNGATKTDDAISAAYLHFSSHGRENVPKALVVITDGITLMKNDLLSKKCQRLRDESGLAIIAVGVGQVEQQGLLSMAGDESNVISIDNFRKMVDFVDRLAMTIQKAIDPSCYSTPKVNFNIEPKAPFRVNQNVQLTCTVETLLTNVEVRILKDNEVVSKNVVVSKQQRGWRLQYSFTVSVQTKGIYQCRVKTETGIVTTGPKIDVLKPKPDSDDLDTAESGRVDVIAPDSTDLSARELCQRCINQRCAVNPGDQCTEHFLNCNNMADPVGLTKCPDGHLFAVEDVKTNIYGNCWTARVCLREKLQKYI